MSPDERVVELDLDPQPEAAVSGRVSLSIAREASRRPGSLPYLVRLTPDYDPADDRGGDGVTRRQWPDGAGRPGR